jgi:transposase-like protein
MRDVIRYSEAFKLRLADDIGNGKYKSPGEARRRNGIRGGPAVKGWIKRYGRELPERVKAETVNGTGELRAARRRIREPEAALSDAHTDCCPGRAFSDIACERLGVSREELKKSTFCGLPKCERDGG